MKSQDKIFAQHQRSEELFSLSNQLLATAKKLSEFHTTELKNSMAYALSNAQTAADQDLAQLKALRSTVATEASIRMAVYQEIVKTILDQMGGKPSNKYLKDARAVLADWYKHAKKKIPQGADQLGQAAHEVAKAGIKAFKKGRKLLNTAANAAEKNLKKAAKKKENTAKKAATQKQAINKSPVKNLRTRKVPTKKIATNTVHPSQGSAI